MATYKGDEQIVIQAPAAMKEALGNYAADHDLAMSEVIRQAIAAMIGFNYEKQPRERARKYDSPEEQKQANYTRAALKRWAASEGAKRLANGEIELATLIARAHSTNDYEAIEMLKAEIEKGEDK